MSTSEWQALILEDVNEHDLYHGRLDGTAGKIIPVRKVQISTADPSKIAILSWRWDGTHEMTGSRNIFCAIHQARKLGIENLFIDVISIDQSLFGDDLLRQVVEFSKLYGNIQVIATYDDVRLEQGPHKYSSTICRPWILSEMKAYGNNATRITHVGHIRAGSSMRRRSDNRNLFAHFVDQLYFVRNTRFTATVLSVLLGSFPMVSISDLKYIMPNRAKLLEASYNKMSRNDYLLTAAISCEVHDRWELTTHRSLWEKDINLMDVIFDRYKFEVGTDADSYEGCNHANIYLDENHVADWLEDHRGDFAIFYLTALPYAEFIITQALQIESFYNEGYSADADFDIKGSGFEDVTAEQIEAYLLDLPSLGICNEED